jgi:hypothetical protein
MTSWLEGFTATGSMRGDPTPLRDDRAKLLESPPVNAARRPTPWPAMGPMSSADQKVGRVSQIASSWRTERRAPTLRSFKVESLVYWVSNLMNGRTAITLPV